MAARAPRWRRALRAGIGAMALSVLGLAAVLILASQTSMGRQVVLKQVLRVVNAEVFEGELRVGRLAGPLFGRLALEQAELFDAEGRRVATLGRLDVTFRLRPLLRGRVDVQRVQVVDLGVEAHIEEDGGLDLADVVRSRGGDRPVRTGRSPVVTLHALELENARFVLRDRRNAGARVVRVEDLRANARLALDARGAFTVTAPEIAADAATPLDPSTLAPVALRDVTLELEGRELALALASLELGETQLVGFEGDAVLAERGSGLPFAHVDVRFPRVLLHPREVNPAIGDELLLAPVAIGASIQGPPERVMLTLPVEGPAGSMEVEAALDLREPATPAYEGDVRVSGVRPERWILLQGVEADVNAGLHFVGRGATPRDLTLDLTLDVSPSVVGPVQVQEARLALSLADARVTLEQLFVRARDATAEGSGYLALEPDERGESLAIDLTVDVPELSRALAEDVDLDAEGAVSLRLEARGDAPLRSLLAGDAPEGLDAWRAWAEGLHAQLDAHAEELRLPGAQLTRADMSASVGGAVDTATGLALDARVRGLQAGALRIDEAQADFSGGTASGALSVQARASEQRLSLTSDARWTSSSLALTLGRLDLSAPGVEVALQEPCDVRLEGNGLAWTSVSVERLSASLFGAEVMASAQLDAAGAVRADVSVDGMPVVEAAAALGFALPLDEGALSAVVGLEGSLQRPRLRVRAALESLRGEHTPASSARALLTYSGGALTGDISLAPADAEQTWIALESLRAPLQIRLDTGEVALSTGGPIAGQLQLSEVPLASLDALVSALPVDVLAGTAGGGATIGGSLSEPEVDLDVSVDGLAFAAVVGGDAFEVEGVDLALRGPARLDGGTLTTGLEASAYVGDQFVAEVTAEGSASLDALSGADLRELFTQPMLLAYRFGPVAASDLPAGIIPPSLRGVGALSGGLQGGPSPRAKATLRLDDVQAFGLGPVSAYVELDAADVAHLEADVDWGETKLASVRAHLGAALGDLVASGLAADAEVDAAATITALPLAWFAPVAPPLEGDTSLLSANVRVSGLAAAPTGDATLRLSGVPFVDGALGDVELSGALASGLATLEGEVRRGEAVHARLEAEARVDLSAEGGGPQSWPLDASLQAEDAPVSTLLPALVFGALLEDVSGVVTTSLEVGGVVAAPTVEGRVRLERVAAGVIPLRRNVEDARLVFDVEHDRLTIEELVVGDEAGSLTGEGSVELAGLSPGSYAPSLSSYALSLRLRDVVAPLDATQSASVRGRAVIEGDLNEERHQTSVMLRNLRVEIVDEGAAGVGATALPETVFFVGEDVDISQVGVRDPVRLGEEAARGS